MVNGRQEKIKSRGGAQKPMTQFRPKCDILCVRHLTPIYIHAREAAVDQSPRLPEIIVFRVLGSPLRERGNLG